MSTMVSKRRSTFGMNCARCDNDLIAPEWSEHRSKQQIRHLWHCRKCDCYFETIVNIKLIEDNVTNDKIFTSRLVA
jgi:hypothetical protein